MIVLYSRVVYTLWFKSDEANQLTHEQMVSVNLEVMESSTINSFSWSRGTYIYFMNFS